MSNLVQKGTLIYQDQTITYILTRKAVKNINLRIGTDNSIKVSAPMRLSLERIEDFLKQKTAWIACHQQIYPKVMPPQIEDGTHITLWGQPVTLFLHHGVSSNSYSNGQQLHLFCRNITDAAKVQRSLQNYLVKEFTAQALGWLDYYSKQLSCPQPIQLTVRHMKSRWGSCRPAQNAVSLNLNMVHAHPRCLQMVTAHELLHFKHRNHSQAFYQDLSLLISDWRQYRQILKNLHV